MYNERSFVFTQYIVTFIYKYKLEFSFVTEKADLTKKVVFKKTKSADSKDSPAPKKVKKSEKDKKKKPAKAVLSFDDEEEEN